MVRDALLVLLAVVALAALWRFFRIPPAFVIAIRDRKPVLLRGSVNPRFLHECEAICRTWKIEAGTLRGVRAGGGHVSLRFSRKMVARDLVKLLQSAVANAQQKDAKLDVDGLVVAHATVDEGPPQKRARARSMGRIYRILKKSSHVSFGLDVVRPKAAPPVRTQAAPAASAPKKAAPKKAAKKAAPKRAAAKR